MGGTQDALTKTSLLFRRIKKKTKYIARCFHLYYAQQLTSGGKTYPTSTNVKKCYVKNSPRLALPLRHAVTTAAPEVEKFIRFVRAWGCGGHESTCEAFEGLTNPLMRSPYHHNEYNHNNHQNNHNYHQSQSATTKPA